MVRVMMLNSILLHFQEGQLEGTSLETTPRRTVTVSDHVTKIKEMKKVYFHVMSVLAGCLALLFHMLWSIKQYTAFGKIRSYLCGRVVIGERFFFFEFPFFGNFFQ